MNELHIYEFAVVLQPKLDKEGDVTEEGRLIVQPTTVLAADENQATLLAGRSIPDEYMDKLDRLTLAVRPF